MVSFAGAVLGVLRQEQTQWSFEASNIDAAAAADAAAAIIDNEQRQEQALLACQSSTGVDHGRKQHNE